MPTNNPTLFRTRTTKHRRIYTCTLNVLPLNSASALNNWAYSRGRYMSEWEDVLFTASVDGPVGSLAGLQLAVQRFDGVTTAVLANGWSNVPAVESSQGSNPFTIASPAPPVSNAAWVISFNAGTTGGTFTLTFGGQTTAPITYTSGLTAAAVQTALVALSSVGSTALNTIGSSGNAVVSGANGGPFTVVLQGDLNYKQLGAMTVNGGSLTGGGSPGASIAAVGSGVIAEAWFVHPGDLVRVAAQWSAAGPSTSNLILAVKGFV